MSAPSEHGPSEKDSGRPDDFLPTTEIISPKEFAATAAKPEPSDDATEVRSHGYEIVGELGRGGVGVVFQARQRALGRMVAVKMLQLGRRANPHVLARFRQEAETIAALKHANIIQIHEVGEWNGTPYLTLEYCEGGNLHQRHAQQPLRPQEAARLLELLARAVEAAHEAGIIHCDLKPANILFLADGTPKITDFGLALRLGEDAANQQKEIVGTPSYMAPEQTGWTRHRVGPATDVYALGAMLYQLLTGRPPFQGPTAVETIVQVVENEPVPPGQLQPRVPHDLETICLKCLAKEPERRYPTAADLAEDLRRYLAGEPIIARPVGWTERLIKRIRRRPVVSALLALLVLVAVAGVTGITVAWQRALASESLAEERERLALEEARKAKEAQREAAAAGVATQKAQALAWQQEQLVREERVQAAAGAQVLRRVEANGNVIQADARLSAPFDPKNDTPGPLDDAGHFLQAVPRDLRFWDWRFLSHQYRGGNAEFRRDKKPPATAVAWSPNGQWLAAAYRGDAIHIWDVAKRRLFRTLAPTSAEVNGLAFDPAHGTLAACDSQGAILVGDIRDQKLQPVGSRHNGAAYCLAFRPDGQELASGGSDGLVRLWETKTRKPLAELATPPGGAVQGVAYSPRGDLLAAATAAGRVFVFSVATRRELFSFQAHKGMTNSVAFSTDGKYLATGGSDNLVKVWRTDREELVQTFSGHQRAVVTVAFCPGSDLLASTSLDRTIHVWDVKTGKPLAWHKQNRQVFSGLCWSPTGDWLASSIADGTIRIWDPLADNASQLWKGHHGDVLALAFAPDSRRLASADADGTTLVRDLSGRVSQRFPGPPAKRIVLAFDPSGKFLAAAASNWDLETDAKPTSAPPEIRIWDTAAGRLHATLQRHTADILAVCWTANGTQLLSAGRDRQLLCWDAATGRVLQSVVLPTGDITALAFKRDGTCLAVGQQEERTQKPEVWLWDIAAKKRRSFPFDSKDTVAHLAFRPDGQQLLVGDYQQLFLCGLKTEEKTQLPLRTLTLRAVAFSADSQRLVSAYGDNKVILWDAHIPQQMLRLTSGTLKARSLAFSPDHSFLAAGNGDGTIKLWDGRPLPRN
jgi:WD40 repeat protein